MVPAADAAAFIIGHLLCYNIHERFRWTALGRPTLPVVLGQGSVEDQSAVCGVTVVA